MTVGHDAVVPRRRQAGEGPPQPAREGILLPVPLWRVSGVDCYLLLDGRDRLVAVLVEHACALAADGAARLALAGYATVGEWLHEFRAQLRPWDHTSAVRSLDERLAELTA